MNAVQAQMRSIPLSVQTQAFDDFTRSLDPETPDYCAHFYQACIIICIHGQAPNVLQTLRLTRSDFFATALRFLTHARTSEDLRRLSVRMSDCRCNQTGEVSRLLHRLESNKASNLKALFEEIASLLMSCFTDIASQPRQLLLPVDASRKRAKKAEKAGRHLPWPEQPTDLFVYPPEQTLAMLWKIFHTYNADSVLLLLQTIMTSSGTTFTSLLHTIPSFPQEFISHFELAISSLVDHPMKFAGLSSFLSLVFLRSGFHDTAQFAIWLPHAHKMLLLFTKAIRLASSSRNFMAKQVTSCLPFIGADMICKYRSFATLELSQYAPEILEVVADSDNLDLLPTAWLSVRRIARSDHCYAPGCTETFSKQNRRFQACSGCGIMAYCSKECQVANWKHESVPHKPLCKALGAYTKKFQGLDWKKTDMWDASTIKAKSEEVGVTGKEARALIQMFNRYHAVAASDGVDDSLDPSQILVS